MSAVSTASPMLRNLTPGIPGHVRCACVNREQNRTAEAREVILPSLPLAILAYRNDNCETLRTVVDAFQTTLAPPTPTAYVRRLLHCECSNANNFVPIFLWETHAKFIAEKNEVRSSCGFGMVYSLHGQFVLYYVLL